MPVRVVFSHDDAIVRIYKQNSDGSQGDVLTENWLYVTGIELTEKTGIVTVPRLFAQRKRNHTTGYDRQLTIDKLHYDKVFDWSLALTKDQDYWIEVEFSDYYVGALNTEPVNDIWEEITDLWENCELIFGENYRAPQTETYILKYCRYTGQSLKTGDINELNKTFSVGTVT